MSTYLGDDGMIRSPALSLLDRVVGLFELTGYLRVCVCAGREYRRGCTV